MARDPRRKESGAPLECRRDVQTALIGTVFCLSAIPNPTIAILIQIIAQAASTCYKKNITKPVRGKRSRMARASTCQCRKDPHLLTWTLGHWLVLLLVLAFSISGSGLVHAEVGNHSASTASFSHEVVPAGDETIGNEPCAGTVDKDNGTTCCISGVCSFCSPLSSSTAAIRAAAVTEMLTALTDDGQAGSAPSPGLRPPSLATNV